MSMSPKEYENGIQFLSAATPLDDMIYLMKRDGSIIVKNLVPIEDIDQANKDVRPRLDEDLEWEGDFFPKQTRRAPSLIARSRTFTITQLMNPIFQAICTHFLTTRNTFWWGDKQKESISLPYAHACVAIEIGPGGKAQPLHRDSCIGHNVLDEIDEWDDDRDRTRESAFGMSVAGTKLTSENGGTQLVPGSHLWGTHRKTQPLPEDCVIPTLYKGDALILFASLYRGGETNTTDEHRLSYSIFMTRGYLRQEENQYLAVPREVVKQYDRKVREIIGYRMSNPACGWVEELDPIFVLQPDLAQTQKPQDF